MTRFLNLTPQSILSPVPLDVFEVQADMLWPEDLSAREAGLRATMTEYSIERLPEAPPEVLEHVRSHLLSRAPRVHEIQPLIDDRCWHGCIAGLHVVRMSVGAEIFGALSLGDLQADISRKLKPNFQIEPRTMNNRTGPLFKFRPVAHLWGAYTILLQHGRKGLPCPAHDLPEFLATAEAIREKAEATRMQQSQYTVMRQGEAFQLPDDVKPLLPLIDFEPYDLSRNRH